MNLLALIPLLGNVLDKIFPDPGAAASAKLELMRLAQNGELAMLAAETDLAKGQLAVNQVEAASTRLFVAGWRPFIGWICGFAMGFKFIGGPLLAMLCEFAGHPINIPDMGFADLLPILIGMLGLGAMRTAEKIKGVS